MKALKLNISAVIFICILIIAGCSDNIISPIVESGSRTESLQIKNKNNSFIRTYTLQAGESVFLDSNITSLRLINSCWISNCNQRRQGLFISTSIIDPPNSLPCSWKNYSLPDLLIDNISGREITFEIQLTGISSN